MTPRRNRIQAWMADRTTFIQYPDVKHTGIRPRPEPKIKAKPVKLDFLSSIILLVYSLVIGAIGLACLVVACVVLYALITGF